MFGLYFVREGEPHQRSPSPVCDSTRIEQRDGPAVLFHDLSDNSEAEARALLSGRHVGLEQPLAVLRRKTLAVVLHVDDRGARLLADADGDDAGLAVEPP